MKLNEIMGTLPSGTVSPLTDDAMAKALRESYVFNDAEKKRRAKMRDRIDLYNGNGKRLIDAMVNDIFKNAKVRELRKKFVELAMFQNLTRRIVREISSVYAEPATRLVKSTRMNANYRRLQQDMRLDRRMRVANQMLNLCNEVVVWFDIRQDKPILRIVTPDNFWAVCHPNDPTHCVALIFDRAPTDRMVDSETTPHYQVVTDTETFSLNSRGRLLSSTRKDHGLTQMPMQLVHRTEPTTSLLDPHGGDDIISGHMALALVNTMMLKHQKSGTKQAYAAGDLGDMPQSQPMDEEHLLQAPEGVSLSTLDLGADPDSYIKAARSIIKQLAANYGIPESVFDLSYQATSGYEIELKRTGLREVRRDQILDWRPVERDLAKIMVEVLAEAESEYAFNIAGWSINFGEVETPQDPMQMLIYWEKRRQMGLMNSIEMLIQLNPEMDEKQAEEQLIANALVEAKRVELYRALNISPTTPADGSDREEDSNSEESEVASPSEQRADQEPN